MATNNEKALPSATPHGYCLPLTLLPLTSMIVLLPTTARGKRSYNIKYCFKNQTSLMQKYTISISCINLTETSWVL